MNCTPTSLTSRRPSSPGGQEVDRPSSQDRYTPGQPPPTSKLVLVHRETLIQRTLRGIQKMLHNSKTHTKLFFTHPKTTSKCSIVPIKIIFLHYAELWVGQCAILDCVCILLQEALQRCTTRSGCNSATRLNFLNVFKYCIRGPLTPIYKHP